MQNVLIQFIDLCTTFQSQAAYEALLPDFRTLCTRYGLSPPDAFFGLRPVLHYRSLMEKKPVDTAGDGKSQPQMQWQRSQKYLDLVSTACCSCYACLLTDGYLSSDRGCEELAAGQCL